MRLIVSVTKSAINKYENPSNKYLLISEKPAWDLLKKWIKVNSEFAHFQFREAVDTTSSTLHIFRNWASSQKSITKSVFPSLNKTLYTK